MALMATATEIEAGRLGRRHATFATTPPPARPALPEAPFAEWSTACEALASDRPAVADRLVDVATTVAANLVPTLTPVERTAFLDGYDAALVLLVRGGWLAQGQADALSRLASAL